MEVTTWGHKEVIEGHRGYIRSNTNIDVTQRSTKELHSITEVTQGHIESQRSQRSPQDHRSYTGFSGVTRRSH